MNVHVKIWSDENKETASRLWCQGYSVRHIASELGVSRNAVIGIANRNREIFPAKAIAAKPAKLKPELKRRRNPPVVFANPRAEWSNIQKDPLPVEFPVLPDEPVSKKRTLTELGNYECVWPTDRENNQHLFCGHDRLKKERYCDFHIYRSLGPIARAKRYGA